MQFKSGLKPHGLNALAILLLCITPVVCVYNAHHYPLLSNAFLFFLIVSIVISVMAYLLCRFTIFYYLFFLIGVALSISYFTKLEVVYGFGISALLVLLLRQKTHIVVLFSTISIMVSSFFIPAENYPRYTIQKHSQASEPENGVENSKKIIRQPVFHLIFDEATGVSGLSGNGVLGEKAKTSLLETLNKHGFTTIKYGFSTSMWTHHSLGHVINLDEVSNAQRIEQKKFGFRNPDNPLFEKLVDNGYEVNVFQSDYLDFCVESESVVTNCYTYPSNSLSYFKDIDFDPLYVTIPLTLQELSILKFVNSVVPNTVNYPIYKKLLAFVGLRIDIPRAYSSVAEKRVRFDFLEKIKASQQKSNQYYFMHFIYPHFSHYQNENCKTNEDFSQWKEINRWIKTTGENKALRINNNDRERLLNNYHAQYICFTKTLDNFLGEILGLYPEATIIVHGDHGSRISTRFIDDSNIENFSYLDLENYNDLYSTLLGFRVPGQEPKELDCAMSLVAFSQYAYTGKVLPKGPNTQLISNKLFGAMPGCEQALPKGLKLLQSEI